MRLVPGFEEGVRGVHLRRERPMEGRWVEPVGGAVASRRRRVGHALAGEQDVAFERVLEKAVHAGSDTRVRAYPQSALRVDAIPNEADLTPSAPDLPEGPLGRLLEARVAGQTTQHCELEGQTAGTGAARLCDLRPALWFCRVGGGLVQRRVDVKRYP